MQKIYVVMGSTGEYSDRSEWQVAAYLEKEMAELHASKAMVAAPQTREAYYAGEKVVNNFDPNMQTDYTGTSYGVAEIVLYRHIDEFLEHPLGE